MTIASPRGSSDAGLYCGGGGSPKTPDRLSRKDKNRLTHKISDSPIRVVPRAFSEASIRHARVARARGGPYISGSTICGDSWSEEGVLVDHVHFNVGRP